MTALKKDSPVSEVRAEFYRRLREDGIPQAKGVLCRKRPDGTVAYCCLGVATEMAVEAGVIEPGEFGPAQEGHSQIKEYSFPSSSGHESLSTSEVLPEPVARWLGFRITTNPTVRDPRNGDFRNVSGVNDRGVRFPKIADLLEASHPVDGPQEV